MERSEAADGLTLTDLRYEVAARPTSCRGVTRPCVTSLVDAVPRGDLDRAVLDAVPDLLDDLEGDERNVLLTLARVVHTLRTGAGGRGGVTAGRAAGRHPGGAHAAR